MNWIFVAGLLCCAITVHSQKDPNVWSNRTALVQLFEWKFSDIAQECENFLAPNGFAGVVVSPVHENLVVPDRPWFERYQVISYNIISRSGDEEELRDMARRCNDVGVRIYVDVVFNHMTGDVPGARGVGGNTADTANLQYPGVPYGPDDFHTKCAIDFSLNSPSNLRDCELLGTMHDLNQSSSHVRERIIGFLDRLVDNGVAGFRIDLANYMWPEDLEYIFTHVKDLSAEHGFESGARPFIFMDILDLGGTAVKETEYVDIGRVSEFKYVAQLGNAFRSNTSVSSLAKLGPQSGLIPKGDALVFVDNHDNQRGNGVPKDSAITYKNEKLYKMATAFMLAYPYGYPVIMSSYDFSDDMQGPPQDNNGTIISPYIKYDGSCGNGWVCEHRWKQIYKMVDFSNAVKGTSVNQWWDNGDKQLAFCRGRKGFIAINNQEGKNLKKILQTCLPAGTYCDIISGSKSYSSCTGREVIVGSYGKAFIDIPSSDPNGVIAIVGDSKL